MNDRQGFSVPDDSDIDAILKKIKSYQSSPPSSKDEEGQKTEPQKPEQNSQTGEEIVPPKLEPEAVSDYVPASELIKGKGRQEEPAGAPATPWWEDPDAKEFFAKAEEEQKKPSYSTLDETNENQVAEELEPATIDMELDPSTFGEKIRQSFYDETEIESTAEQEIPNGDPIERPGLIVKKGVASKTSDLDPMPRVLPAEEVLRSALLEQEKTKLGQGTSPPPKESASVPEDYMDGQIVFRGFNSPEADGDRIGIKSAEEELYLRRREKARDFVDPKQAERAGYDDPSKSGGKSGENTTGKKKLEYHFHEQGTRINRFLFISRKRTLTALIALGLIELFSLFLLFLPQMLESAAVESTVFGHGGKALILLQLFLLCLAAFFGIRELASGFMSLFKGRPNCDLPAALVVTATALHLIFSLFLSPPENYLLPTFTSLAVFSLLISTLSRLVRDKYTHGNFRFCAFDAREKLHTMASVDGSDASLELSKGLLMSNPGVIYSAPLGFPTNFIENSRDFSGSEKFCSVLLYCVLALSALSGLIAGLVGKNILFGLSVFTGALCVGSPPGAIWAYTWPLYLANKRLNSQGAMVTNPKAAFDLSENNAFVLDSADLFDRQACVLHGFKEYKRIRLDDVLLYAAAMIIRSGGPLSDAFDSLINKHRDLLPKVTDFAYEDRQGISGLIHKQTVLMGNRTFMNNHTVLGIPDKSEEDKYKKNGRRVLYLAVANKVAALFVVSYAVDKSLASDLKKLQKNDFSFLVHTRDVNVTEEMLSESLGLAINKVKVVGTNANRLLRRLGREGLPQAPSEVLHDGSAHSFLKSLVSVLDIKFSARATKVLQALAAGLGLAALILFTALSSPDRFGPAQILLFQAFWLALASIIAAIRNL